MPWCCLHGDAQADGNPSLTVHLTAKKFIYAALNSMAAKIVER